MTGGRRGAALLEVMVATALLAAMTSVCLQAMAVKGRQRLELERRGWALQAASNLLERLTGRDWEAITPQAAAQLKLPADAERTLPAGQLDVRVVLEQTAPEAKRINVVIRWQNASGRQAAPMRLSAWVYRKGTPTE